MAKAAWTCTACGADQHHSGTHCTACGASRAPLDALSEIRGAELLRAPTHTPVAPPTVTPEARAGLAKPQDPVRPKPSRATQLYVPVLDPPPAEGVQPATGSTDIGGLPAVRPLAAERRAKQASSRSRSLPLALLVVFLGTMAVLAVRGVMRPAQAVVVNEADGALDPLALVQLPATTALLGLSEDNKEAVLNLCWRVSGNPTHECRPSYLQSLREYPATEVEIPALDVMRYEVSNGAWDACEARGDCPARDIDACRSYTIYRYELGRRPPTAVMAPDRPAVCVNWEEAQAFCAAHQMRLPSPAEWERIARSGDDRLQPWGRFWTPALANWGERDLVGFPIPGRLDGAELTAAVDAYADGATRDGVYNVLGNVAEWVSRVDDDPDAEAGIRGGSYVDDALTARLTRHQTLAQTERRTTVGFRCVRQTVTP